MAVPAYQLRLYKRRPGSMPLHDHVRSVHVEADSDEEAVEHARVAEFPDLLSDCAIVFNDARSSRFGMCGMRKGPGGEKRIFVAGYLGVHI